MTGVAFVECSLGFAVVPHPGNGSLCSTVSSPRLVIERLSKEIEDVAIGPVRLVESMGFDVFFRKVLTPLSWGTLVWENIYALNALTGGTMAQMLRRRSNRLVLAAMIRECSVALKAAARGGKWQIDFSLVVGSSLIVLTPWTIELMLVLPDALYYPFAFITGLSSCVPTSLSSPLALDIDEGRETMARFHMLELLSSGERYKVKMPVCNAVYDTIRGVEYAKNDETVPRPRPPYQQRMKPVEEATFFDSKTGNAKRSASVQELWFWVIRFLAVLSLLAVLLHLLMD